MSTRSVIARPFNGGWTGVYCHSDGYPTNQVAAIRRIMRDVHSSHTMGTRDALLARSWEFLPAEHMEQRLIDSYLNRPEYEVLPGYGIALASKIKVSSKDDPFGLEWAYVLHHTGIDVHACLDGGWTFIATVRWSDPAPNLTAIECGSDWSRCSHMAFAHDKRARHTNYGMRVWIGQDPTTYAMDAKWVVINERRRALTGSGYAADGQWLSHLKGSKRPVATREVLPEGKVRLKFDHILPATAARGELVVPAGTEIAG